MLPLALSQINEYAQKSAVALLNLVLLCGDESLPHGAHVDRLPELLPHETLKVLSDTVDTVLLENLVAWIQIHDSRVRGLIQESPDPSGVAIITSTEILGSVIDAASIYSAASALFNYARRREDRAPIDISWADLRNGLMNMRLWEEEHPRLYQIVAGRETRSQGPFDRLNV